MNKSLTFIDLLKRLGLEDQRLPDLATWEMLLSQFSSLIGNLEDQVKQSESHILMSYSEMQEWSYLIEQRETAIKSILDSSLDLIITLNSSGHILEFNHRAEVTFGLSKDEVKGKSILDVIHDGEFYFELHECFVKEDVQNRGKGFNVHLERKLKYKDGTPFPANINFTKHVMTRENLYVLYIRDLTEELRAKQELDANRVKSAQSAKMASLGEMAGGIAHEINTPLGVIMMNAELLKEEIDTDDINKDMFRKSLGMILSTSTRIAKIITGLRNFSREDSKAPMELINLNQVVEDTLSLCGQRMKQHAVDLKYGEIPTDWKILGRAVGLSQVILNLLNNSYDAIDGLPEKWIHLDFEEKNDEYHIVVLDSGSGIPDALQEKLMQPFFTTKPVGKGTGLGLSISKGIVESMKGKLIYALKDNHTSFTIVLPKFKIAA